MDCSVEVKTQSVTLQKCITHFANILSDTEITTQPQAVLSLDHGLKSILKILIHCREKSGTVYVIGNGGSAAIASHMVIDLVNMVKMRAMAMLDPAVTTCISNDYGYEQIYAKQLSQFIRSEDILIAISSSGNSKNIINAVDIAKKTSAKVITLSGFSENNALRQVGDYNLWLNSKDYGQVEIGHAFLLHYLTDRLAEMLKSDINFEEMI
ncbi:MAG: SIS domain-containing protein [Coxiellaceae bacterium]|nr:SIS domain-containing protein [Coxiellaceae bacterium]